MKPEIKTIAAAEEWRPVKGYEGLYEVSNMGRIKSVARLTTRPCQYGIKNEYRIPEKILHANLSTGGYLCVNLSHDGKEVTKRIHRLVAIHFCKGYRDGMVVNHIDEDKTNNRADNLEWVTQKANVNHGTGIQRRKKYPKAVVQISLSGEVVNVWPSVKSASESVGVNPACIGHCCKGDCPTIKGYSWKWADKE